MSQEPTKQAVACYKTWGMEFTACGRVPIAPHINATAMPALVECDKCRRSYVFQEHVILKEVGFGGNFTEFYEHLKNTVVTD